LHVVWELTRTRAPLGFPRPQRVPIALEIGVQNKLVGISVIALILSGPDRDTANAVPIIYAVFASCFACLWGALAWQMRWTYLDPNAGLWTALKETRADIHAELVAAQDKGRQAGELTSPTVEPKMDSETV